MTCEVSSEVTCEVRSAVDCEVRVKQELQRSGNIVSEINAKCQYFVTHVFVYAFLMSREESREVSCHLSCALTLIMTEMQNNNYVINKTHLLVNCEVRREVPCDVTLLDL